MSGKSRPPTSGTIPDDASPRGRDPTMFQGPWECTTGRGQTRGKGRKATVQPTRAAQVKGAD